MLICRYFIKYSLKDLLEHMGDNFSAEEVGHIPFLQIKSNERVESGLVYLQIRQTWKEAPIQGGQVDYEKFVHIIKRGNEEL